MLNGVGIGNERMGNRYEVDGPHLEKKRKIKTQVKTCNRGSLDCVVLFFWSYQHEFICVLHIFVRFCILHFLHISKIQLNSDFTLVQYMMILALKGTNTSTTKYEI